MKAKPANSQSDLDQVLTDTGERMVPEFHKGKLLYGEHIIRYESAVELVKDKIVLDIASGSGYGSAQLAKSAKKVYGVDLDPIAIEYSKKNFGKANIEFMQGDGVTIPLGDNSVDVVVSYETIEHIEDYRTFLDEVKRVLKSDGVFLLSTPNDLESPEGNHYHIHEFEHQELLELARQYFKYIESCFQGTWLYTAVVNEQELQNEWQKQVETINLSPLTPDTSMYFFYVCSNVRPVPKISSLAAISEHLSMRRNMETEASMRNHMEEQAKVMNHLDGLLKAETAKNEAIGQQNAQLEAKIGKLRNSPLLLPYRVLVKIKRAISK